MKHTKKVLALLLMFVMALGMATTALAAPESTTITSPRNDHEYSVYQIMYGELHEGVLSNIKWGRNGKLKTGNVDQATLEALASVDGLSDTEKLAVIEQFVDLDSPVFGTIAHGSGINVPTGYYLIKDKGPLADGEDYSLYIVEVAGPTTITPKTGTTSSEKKVLDDEQEGWQDSADYDIGDEVPFQLSATVASDYDNYARGYKLTFHDKLDAGLTFNKNSVKVYVDGNEITQGFRVLPSAADGDSFDVTFVNLKDVTSVQAGSVITVEYTATLNDKAKVGTANKNTSHITYTNNPNDAQAGENGKTPDDTVVVFTYELVINKYSNSVTEENRLAGAEFTLSKGDEYIGVVKSTDGTTFTFTGLDEGTYTLTETKTPDGYNTIEPITIEVKATHEAESADAKLTGLTASPNEQFTVEMTEDQEPTGVISGDIINKGGSLLPSTGGMGTTIFYALGSLLMVGVSVVVYSKRRASHS